MVLSPFTVIGVPACTVLRTLARRFLKAQTINHRSENISGGMGGRAPQ